MHGLARALQDLAVAFRRSDDFIWNVDELLNHRRAWRGELLLRSEGNREKCGAKPE